MSACTAPAIFVRPGRRAPVKEVIAVTQRNEVAS